MGWPESAGFVLQVQMGGLLQKAANTSVPHRRLSVSSAAIMLDANTAINMDSGFQNLESHPVQGVLRIGHSLASTYVQAL
jgi:hypothetical protein